VAPGPAEGAGQADRVDGWSVAAGASRDDIEAEVRRRAATDRDSDTANPVSASWPLHMVAPLAPAPTGSSKPLFRTVKRTVHRLIGWEVVPIVEQLNHLQRATIEAIDRQSADGAQAGAAQTAGPGRGAAPSSSS
jgi:hypothetical protein